MRRAARSGKLIGSNGVMAYWVVGGEYRDATFTEMAPGAQKERLGPFASYEEAYKVWASRAWATVDNALMRFRIVRDDESAA
jgi:Domain of unknown function (DUF4170)